MSIVTKNLRLNEMIRVPQVRLIDENNNQVGVIDTRDAIDRAREVGLDLVEVAPNSKPPVCRLMDYGKHKYDQKKKEHRAKVKQHHTVVKEVRLRPKIDDHDVQTKLKKSREFLAKGNKVQFTMLFKGREMAHTELGMEIFDEIIAALSDIGKIESPAKRMGRRITMVVGSQPAGKSGKPSSEKAESSETPPIRRLGEAITGERLHIPRPTTINTPLAAESQSATDDQQA
ncbi:MAG: translation initiation factor IF-3 [Sedimentisphaerales bacterium]|nr:translation initiation factor IF-3 [Sedimentisphaerales bacterium]